MKDLYLDGEGLGRWLTEGPPGIRRDGRFQLRLKGGRTLTGSVLALTDHEVAVSWHEVDGILEFKAFGAGPDARVLGLRAITWSDDEEMVGALRPQLEAAVDRLVAGLGTS